MNDDFFIGWAGRVPVAQRGVIAMAVAVLLGLCLILPLTLARATSDPAAGAFDWDAGEQTRTGTLTLAPYPTLWIAPDAAHPHGHTLILSGEGKERPDLDAAADGRLIEAHGFLIRRAEAETMQVSETKLLDGTAPAPDAASLGTWRVAGEICDGKCALGAMRPGIGVAHRPCANLCLTGGLPPVLLSAAGPEGGHVLLLGDRAGGALPERVHDAVARPLVLTGVVDRRGDLLILRTDLP